MKKKFICNRIIIKHSHLLDLLNQLKAILILMLLIILLPLQLLQFKQIKMPMPITMLTLILIPMLMQMPILIIILIPMQVLLKKKKRITIKWNSNRHSKRHNILNRTSRVFSLELLLKIRAHQKEKNSNIKLVTKLIREKIQWKWANLSETPISTRWLNLPPNARLRSFHNKIRTKIINKITRKCSLKLKWNR